MTQDKETLRERPRLEMIAFAAWVNIDVDKIPPEFRAPTCEHTMKAWKRVADAIEADVFERLRTPSEGMIEAVQDCGPIGCCIIHEYEARGIIDAVATAFQQENSDAE